MASTELDALKAKLIDRQLKVLPPSKPLAALTVSTSTPSDATDKEIDALEWEPNAVSIEEIPVPYRLIWTGSRVTLDYCPTRLNVALNDKGIIKGLYYA